MITPTPAPAPMTADEALVLYRAVAAGQMRDGLAAHIRTYEVMPMLDALVAHIDALAELELSARFTDEAVKAACEMLNDEHTKSVAAMASELRVLTAELAAARKVEDGEVNRWVRNLRGAGANQESFPESERLRYRTLADLLTRLSAALKEAERAEERMRDALIAEQRDRGAWANRAQAAEAKLEQAALIVEGQSVAVNHLPPNIGGNSLATFLTERDFKAANQIRALQTKDTTP